MFRLVFILTATGITCLGYLYVASRLPLHGGWPWVLGLGAWALTLGSFFVRFTKRCSLGWDLLAWVGYCLLGLVSLYVPFFLFTDLLGFLGVLVPDHLVFATGTLVFFIGFANSQFPAVWKVSVSHPKVGSNAGFRIVQISDVHIGATMKSRFARRIVRTVNALQADLVVVTGDLVDGKVEDLGPHVAELGKLQAKHGVAFVTGNHDYYSGPHPWKQFLKGLGWRVLSNEHWVVQEGLILGGVEDRMSRHMDRENLTNPKRAREGAPEGYSILLCHQPDPFEEAIAAGWDLQLTGHTHGGQYFPYTWIIHLFQTYVRGLYHLNGSSLYINRGTGFWGPPLRFPFRGEISLIELKH